jgi:hypothetical protein
VRATTRDARGIAVQPVHKPGLLTLLVAPRLEHLVDIAGDAGAALDGKAGGLVENQDLRVLVQKHLAEHIAIVAVADGLGGQRASRFLIDAKRRHPDRLAWLNTRVGLDPATVDTDLPGAEQLLQLTESQTRKMDLEPAIEPHARFVGINLYELYARHIDYLFDLGIRTGAPAIARQTMPEWKL